MRPLKKHGLMSQEHQDIIPLSQLHSALFAAEHKVIETTPHLLESLYTTPADLIKEHSNSSKEEDKSLLLHITPCGDDSSAQRSHLNVPRDGTPPDMRLLSAPTLTPTRKPTQTPTTKPSTNPVSDLRADAKTFDGAVKAAPDAQTDAPTISPTKFPTFSPVR